MPVSYLPHRQKQDNINRYNNCRPKNPKNKHNHRSNTFSSTTSNINTSKRDSLNKTEESVSRSRNSYQQNNSKSFTKTAIFFGALQLAASAFPAQAAPLGANRHNLQQSTDSIQSRTSQLADQPLPLTPAYDDFHTSYDDAIPEEPSHPRNVNMKAMRKRKRNAKYQSSSQSESKERQKTSIASKEKSTSIKKKNPEGIPSDNSQIQDNTDNQNQPNNHIQRVRRSDDSVSTSEEPVFTTEQSTTPPDTNQTTDIISDITLAHLDEEHFHDCNFGNIDNSIFSCSTYNNIEVLHLHAPVNKEDMDIESFKKMLLRFLPLTSINPYTMIIVDVNGAEKASFRVKGSCKTGKYCFYARSTPDTRYTFSPKQSADTADSLASAISSVTLSNTFPRYIIKEDSPPFILGDNNIFAGLLSVVAISSLIGTTHHFMGLRDRFYNFIKNRRAKAIIENQEITVTSLNTSEEKVPVDTITTNKTSSTRQYKKTMIANHNARAHQISNLAIQISNINKSLDATPLSLAS